MAQCCIAEQRVDGCQTVVARANDVVALVFQVVQEGAHQRSVEICDIQLARLLVFPTSGVAEEQSERIAVGSDGVRARATLCHQPIREERLECGREQAHGLTPKRASTRAAASSISSGAAERYQYVPAGLTCPR